MLMHLLASLFLLAGEIPLTSAAKVVPFRFRAGTPRAQTLDFSKRDTVSIELANARMQYLVTLQVGNPPQDVLTIIDTGSADLWLMGTGNPFCSGASDSNIASQYRVDCKDGALFNSDDSSSWTDNSTQFYIEYLDTSVALGSYGQDDLSINGATISKANFALVNQSNITAGVFGIGPRNQEAVQGATADSNGVVTGLYDNIPIQMKQQGLISSISYSLYLDHMEEESGTLLFGGVDHAKYKGNLGVVPVLFQRLGGGIVPQEPLSLTVILNGLGVKDHSGNSQWLAEVSLMALLDSGATFSLLPAVIIRPIADALNAEYSPSAQHYIVYCETAGSIILDFSGVQVEVPVEAMVTPALSTSGSPMTDNAGKPVCYLGLDSYGQAPVSSQIYVLGDSILRGLYVVYDLENWEIGIATGDLDTESSDIEEITDGIPRGSSAPSYSSMTVSSSYSTATRISVFLTHLNSGGEDDEPTSTSGTESPTGTESPSARSSSGAPSGGAGTSNGESPGATSSSRIADSATSVAGGDSSDGGERGASKSSTSLWLAGIFMLLL